MATLTVYADTADNALGCSNNTFATARAGTGCYIDSVSAENHEIGCSYFAPTYYLNELGLPFDTSALGAGATISSAVLALYGKADGSTTDFTIECAAYDFGAAIDTGDWQDGTELAALTIVATLSTAGFSTSGYNNFSDSGPGLASVINKTGTTRLFLWHPKIRTGVAPTGSEYVDVWSANEAQTGERRPQLTITYTTATPAKSPIIGGGFF